MKIGLFIPCYIDQFYPQVGIATLQLLEKLGCEVDYPSAQTCCGQPMANAGGEEASKPVYQHFVNTFKPYDYIVAPSGSCTYHVKKHYGILPQTDAVDKVRNAVFDLSEFLVDILQVEKLDARFPHKVGLHQSCHGQRGLRLASASERVEAPYSKTKHLLEMVDGIELEEPQRADECCGFGGTFAVVEEAISVKMGKDRIKDHLNQGVSYITATDMSCLMHLEGILRRNKQELKIIHLAEILNGNNLNPGL